ncbi:MAG: hypothetical protein WCG26_09350 [Chloroflexales bacterium]
MASNGSNGSRGDFHPYRDAHGRFAATPSGNARMNDTLRRITGRGTPGQTGDTQPDRTPVRPDRQS